MPLGREQADRSDPGGDRRAGAAARAARGPGGKGKLPLVPLLELVPRSFGEYVAAAEDAGSRPPWPPGRSR